MPICNIRPLIPLGCADPAYLIALHLDHFHKGETLATTPELEVHYRDLILYASERTEIDADYIDLRTEDFITEWYYDAHPELTP